MIEGERETRTTRSRSTYGLDGQDRMQRFEESVNQVDRKVRGLTEQLIAS